MDTSIKIVSARIPREIRDQGDVALKRIDATVTELVNAAFEYVIKTGQLPSVQNKPVPEQKTVRTFSPQQKEQFNALIEATSLELAPEFANLSAKEIKNMRLDEKYGNA